MRIIAAGNRRTNLLARPIMIQGTMSSAGKSLIAAALCRIFHQDGYKAAPFKSQNMALNSYITREGLEMGRAQVMQAEAAGIVPSVDMNPILLKPTGDSVSQVIVNGEVLGDFSAKDYFAMKKSLIPDIRKAYDRLSEENDIIVIEGAGSPAEINLKENDIVNMGMAKIAEAPVILVGDIDRGGVFAQLYGTVALLEKEEREKYLKGLIINKFRGDVSILNPGLSQIEELTGKPLLGVVPYIRVDVDDEDSLSERLKQKEGRGLIDIAVVRLPRISNFTDFNALSRVPGVSVRYIGTVHDFGDPDLIILPGTKNTMGDLRWLRENGLEALIKRTAAAGKQVIGICGGYQMLGETLNDPYGVDSGTDGKERIPFMRGLGLLPVDTVFTEKKTRTSGTGILANPAEGFESLKGHKIEGYEIHMGKSTVRKGSGALPLARLSVKSGGRETFKEDGCRSKNVCGTYVHGIFDSKDTALLLAKTLAERKGISLEQAASYDPASYREKQYDLLADSVRKRLDMGAVYRILEEGV